MSLTDAVKASAGRLPPKRRAKAPRRPSPAPSLTQVLKTVGHKRNPPASRAGRKGILLHFEQHVAAAIRRLAIEYDATNQELGEWAFKVLFEKFGEPWPG